MRHLLISALIFIFNTAIAENVVWPTDAGVVDVTKPPYNLKGDGKMDCTAGLQQAFDDHLAGNYIIHFSRKAWRIGNRRESPRFLAERTPTTFA